MRATATGGAAASSMGATAANTQRGYFGDVASAGLADATAGPSSDRSFGGGASAAKGVPFAYAFKSAGGGAAALSRKLHAHGDHTGESISVGASSAGASYNPFADVPERALQPKVFFLTRAPKEVEQSHVVSLWSVSVVSLLLLRNPRKVALVHHHHQQQQLLVALVALLLVSKPFCVRRVWIMLSLVAMHLALVE